MCISDRKLGELRPSNSSSVLKMIPKTDNAALCTHNPRGLSLSQTARVYCRHHSACAPRFKRASRPEGQRAHDVSTRTRQETVRVVVVTCASELRSRQPEIPLAAHTFSLLDALNLPCQLGFIPFGARANEAFVEEAKPLVASVPSGVSFAKERASQWR